MSKPALGRGLGALLGGNPSLTQPASAPVISPAAPDNRDRVQRVPLNRVRPSTLQPRKEFAPEALQELADSIREQGIVQPLIVRERGGFFELIAGERRWRAAQLLNLPEVPVITREADDRTVLELALIENLQRENLNALEEALGYAKLGEEFQLTQEEIAVKVGKSRAAVANATRLLKLPVSVQGLLREGRISVGHAKVILGLTGDDRHFGKIQQLRGPPTAFTGDEFKKTAAFAYDERLYDALLADGIGQFLQCLGRKFLARLQSGRANAVQRHTLHAVAVVRRSGRNDRGGRRLRERRIAAQQRAQSASQCRF